MVTIRKTTAAIEQAVQDERAAKLARDQALYEAWCARESWASIMAASGLSRRGVSLALDRMRERLGSAFQER